MRAAVVALIALAASACACTSPRSAPSADARGAAAAPPAPAPPPRDEEDDDDADDAPPPAPPPGGVGPGGNQKILRFDEAKKELGRIYASAPARIDLYCGCAFLPEPGKGLRVDLASCGYVPAEDATRAARIEWEHAVPAAAFGHTFAEWTMGSPRCKNKKGRTFKGRKCARVASPEFARIEADMHNLFPVVGEVNGLRGDLPMGVLDPPSKAAHHGGRSSFHFGRCASAIERGVFMPRPEVRGDLARAYEYMDASYPGRGLVDDAHRALFQAWDKADPPDAWERERNRLIAARQGNLNPFIP